MQPMRPFSNSETMSDCITEGESKPLSFDILLNGIYYAQNSLLTKHGIEF